MGVLGVMGVFIIQHDELVMYKNEKCSGRMLSSDGGDCDCDCDHVSSSRQGARARRPPWTHCGGVGDDRVHNEYGLGQCEWHEYGGEGAVLP